MVRDLSWRGEPSGHNAGHRGGMAVPLALSDMMQIQALRGALTPCYTAKCKWTLRLPGANDRLRLTW